MEQIEFDDFLKVDLRVGQILAAEPIEKSEKLLRLEVTVGEDEPRQIVAGIAKFHEPSNLVGRKVVVVANLKPAKLMGFVSEGMLLCASDEVVGLELLNPGDAVAPGSRVS